MSLPVFAHGARGVFLVADVGAKLYAGSVDQVMIDCFIERLSLT